MRVFSSFLDIDSSGKPGAGILQGNLWWMGAYDQCVELKDAHFCSMTNVALVAGPNKTVFFHILYFHILILVDLIFTSIYFLAPNFFLSLKLF